MKCIKFLTLSTSRGQISINLDSIERIEDNNDNKTATLITKGASIYICNASFQNIVSQLSDYDKIIKVNSVAVKT